jgi:mono/diheme cytochrome c family protein
MTKAPSPYKRAKGRRAAKRLATALLVASMLSSCLPVSEEDHRPAAAERSEGGWPAGDPSRGKRLFVDKACFVCHSVNGAGGRAALPLDAPPDGREVDPMVFAAAMWRGASAMLSLQLTELGYQIDLSANEIRDLAAFASDLETQAGFSLDDIPAPLRPWIIDAPYWLDEAWPDSFEAPPEETPPFEDL